MNRPLLILLLLVLASNLVWAGDSPGFRGPQGNGVSPETGVPHEWSSTENVKWKTPLPGDGNSSPIVSNGKVFLSTAVKGGKERGLYCFDRASGKELWTRVVKFESEDPTHKTNPYDGSSPAADGERVVVWHGSAGLHCYDFNGRKLWSRELGEFKHMWGYGSSPVIHKGRVIMNCGPGQRVFMGCFDLASGKTIWEQEEPQEGNGERRGTDMKYMGSWATPIITKVGGVEQIVCTMSTRVNGYDPETGKILWSCDGIRGPKGDLAYSSALVSDGFCVATGGFNGPSIGFAIKGQGNITEAQRHWRKVQNPQSIGSGVVLGDHYFMANAGPGTLQCIETKTGKVAWQKRSPVGTAWGSIVMADGLLFVTGQNGGTVVFQPDTKKFVEVAVNKLGEPSNSTPAFSDGEIFIRTMKHLYCIAKKK